MRFPELSRKLLGGLSKIPQEQRFGSELIGFAPRTPGRSSALGFQMTASSCPAKIRPLGDTIVRNDRNKTVADDDLNVLERRRKVDGVGSFSDLDLEKYLLP